MGSIECPAECHLGATLGYWRTKLVGVTNSNSKSTALTLKKERSRRFMSGWGKAGLGIANES